VTAGLTCGASQDSSHSLQIGLSFIHTKQSESNYRSLHHRANGECGYVLIAFPRAVPLTDQMQESRQGTTVCRARRGLFPLGFGACQQQDTVWRPRDSAHCLEERKVQAACESHELQKLRRNSRHTEQARINVTAIRDGDKV
jgi:hypothetical protein